MHSVLFAKLKFKIFLINLLEERYCNGHIVNIYLILKSFVITVIYFPDWIYLKLCGQVDKAFYIYALVFSIIILKEQNLKNVLHTIIYLNILKYILTSSFFYLDVTLNHPNTSLIFELYLCICNVLLANRNNESILFYFIFNMILNIILTYFKGFTYFKEIEPAYKKMYQMLIAVSHNFTNVIYSTNIFFKYTVKFCIYDIMTGLNASLVYDIILYVFSKLTIYIFLWIYYPSISIFNLYNINNFSSYIVIIIVRRGSPSILSILLPSHHVKSEFN